MAWLRSEKVLTRVMLCICMMLGIVVLYAPFAHAQQEADTKIVGDFADYIINILTGPIAKLLACVILIGGVIALFKGNQALAITCLFAFLILMFVPQLLKAFQTTMHH